MALLPRSYSNLQNTKYKNSTSIVSTTTKPGGRRPTIRLYT